MIITAYTLLNCAFLQKPRDTGASIARVVGDSWAFLLFLALFCIV